MRKVWWLLTLVLVSSLAATEPGEVYWSEGFEGYAPGDLPSQDATWVADNLAGANVHTGYPYSVGDPGLDVSVGTSPGGYWLGTLTKDLSGELETIVSDRVGYAFDCYNGSAPDAWRGHEQGFHVMDPCDNNIGYLMMRDSGPYQFNGQAIPGDYWVRGTNHFLMDMDFANDTIDLYINYEETPRLTVPMGADYDAADIAKLRFDAAVYWKTGRTAYCYADSLQLYDTREWICPDADVTDDCYVDLDDFGVVSGNWLQFDIDPNNPVAHPDPNGP